jgi:hypothetical protein
MDLEPSLQTLLTYLAAITDEFLKGLKQGAHHGGYTLGAKFLPQIAAAIAAYLAGAAAGAAVALLKLCAALLAFSAIPAAIGLMIVALASGSPSPPPPILVPTPTQVTPVSAPRDRSQAKTSAHMPERPGRADTAKQERDRESGLPRGAARVVGRCLMPDKKPLPKTGGVVAPGTWITLSWSEANCLRRSIRPPGKASGPEYRGPDQKTDSPDTLTRWEAEALVSDPTVFEIRCHDPTRRAQPFVLCEVNVTAATGK